jgi:hypothetical protein
VTFWERSEERLIKGASLKQAVGHWFMLVPISLLAVPLLRGVDYLGRSLTPEQWVLISALLAFCVLLVAWRIVRPAALVLNVNGMSAPGQSRSILWREVSDLSLGRLTWWPLIRVVRMKRQLQGKTSTIYIPDIYEMNISELAALLEEWRVRHSAP